MQQQQQPPRAVGNWRPDGFWEGPGGTGYHYKKIHRHKYGNGYLWNGHFYPAFTFISNQNGSNMPYQQQQQQQWGNDMSGNNLSDTIAQGQQFSMQHSQSTPAIQNMQPVSCPPGRSRYVQNYGGNAGRGDDDDDDDYSDEDMENPTGGADDDEDDYDDDDDDDDDMMAPVQKMPVMNNVAAQPQMQNAGHLSIGGAQVVSHVSSPTASATTITNLPGMQVGDRHGVNDRKLLRFVTFSVLAKVPSQSELESEDKVNKLIESGRMTEDGQIVASLGNRSLVIVKGNHAAELLKAESDAMTGGGSSSPIFPAVLELHSYQNSHTMPILVEFDGILEHSTAKFSANAYPNPNVSKYMPAKSKVDETKEVLMEKSVNETVVDFIRTHKNIRPADLRKIAKYDDDVKTFRVNRFKLGEGDKQVSIPQAELLRTLYRTYAKVEDEKDLTVTDLAYEIKKELFERLLQEYEQDMANAETPKDLRDLTVLIAPKYHGLLTDDAPNYYARLWYQPDASVGLSKDYGHTITLAATLFYISSNTQ